MKTKDILQLADVKKAPVHFTDQVMNRIATEKAYVPTKKRQLLSRLQKRWLIIAAVIIFILTSIVSFLDNGTDSILQKPLAGIFQGLHWQEFLSNMDFSFNSILVILLITGISYFAFDLLLNKKLRRTILA